MIPKTNTTVENIMPLEWLVCYSNSGDISILDNLKDKQEECATTGIHDFFVPLDVSLDAPTRLIAGNYIFIKATKEDILRLRQEPPFDATLRFLHPSADPMGCIYITDEEIQMMRKAVGLLGGQVEYFVPTNKEIMAGDSVCILDGKFAGLKGVLESVKGHEGGCVIVPLGDVLAVRTPRISACDIQLLELAKVSDSGAGSYTSRAYKKINTLISDSENMLAEKEERGALSEESASEARRLIKRFSQLQLNGKIRFMHAQAIYNLFVALGDTDNEVCQRFRNMLP
ncbi:MAG: KOW motif-containing protein [Bacteroidaceae bacterium]|jgi:transcription antitermination factor NusG|nr:KOW motif-containing protein [Bacteroidaceae bacterium]